MKETRFIIAGGRDFNDLKKLEKEADNVIQGLQGRIIIISGAANGADKLGEKYAIIHNLEVVKFPANWNLYGKSAGPRRNAEMAKYASEENGILLAFWDGESRGTRNMIENAKRCNLKIKVVKY